MLPPSDRPNYRSLLASPQPLTPGDMVFFFVFFPPGNQDLQLAAWAQPVKLVLDCIADIYFTKIELAILVTWGRQISNYLFA